MANGLEATADREYANLAQNQRAEASAESIDDKIDDDTPVGFFGSLGRFSLWDWTKVLGLGYASFASISYMINPTIAAINLGATLANYMIGHSLVYRDNMTKNNLHGEIQLAQTMAPLSSLGLLAINAITDPWYRVAAGLVALPAYVYGYTYGSEIVRNYTLSEFVQNPDKAFEEGAESSRKKFKGVGAVALLAGVIPYSLIINYLPFAYQLPAIEAMGPVTRYLTRNVEHKAENK